MQAELQVLLITAVSIACLHTLTGPDHYVPFIALSKARGWSVTRTIFWTIICGCGHVWSSIILGLSGAAIGWSLSKVTWLESVRGGIAGWALVAFGIIYSTWGTVKAIKGHKHKHFDVYDDGSIYVYEHTDGELVAPGERYAVTPWVIFLIFVLGPCEPMIPLLYFPAAKNSLGAMMSLIIVYTIFTLGTMVLMVVLGYFGFAFFQSEKLERYLHATAGVTILICGIGMVFLNW